MNKNISIEQFAAFLDGNLPEDELQVVEAAIDSQKVYSDILGEVMQVDDSIAESMDQSAICPDMLSDIDFELPIVPEFVLPSDVVELTNLNDSESVAVEFLKDDVHIAMASEETGIAANCSCHCESQVNNPSSCDNLDMEQQAEDVNDLLF